MLSRSTLIWQQSIFFISVVLLPSQEELIEIPDIGVDLKATSIQIDKKILTI